MARKSEGGLGLIGLRALTEIFFLPFTGDVIMPAFSKNDATWSVMNCPPKILIYSCGPIVGTKDMMMDVVVDRELRRKK